MRECKVQWCLWSVCSAPVDDLRVRMLRGKYLWTLRSLKWKGSRKSTLYSSFYDNTWLQRSRAFVFPCWVAWKAGSAWTPSADPALEQYQLTQRTWQRCLSGGLWLTFQKCLWKRVRLSADLLSCYIVPAIVTLFPKRLPPSFIANFSLEAVSQASPPTGLPQPPITPTMRLSPLIWSLLQLRLLTVVLLTWGQYCKGSIRIRKEGSFTLALNALRDTQKGLPHTGGLKANGYP